MYNLPFFTLLHPFTPLHTLFCPKSNPKTNPKTKNQPKTPHKKLNPLQYLQTFPTLNSKRANKLLKSFLSIIVNKPTALQSQTSNVQLQAFQIIGRKQQILPNI